MKMLVGFVIGAVTVLTALFSLQLFIPLQAHEEPGQELSSLLPDIAKINREALVTPLLEAEKTIWDKDVGNYYRLLLSKIDISEKTEP